MIIACLLDFIRAPYATNVAYTIFAIASVRYINYYFNVARKLIGVIHFVIVAQNIGDVSILRESFNRKFRLLQSFYNHLRKELGVS
jgi:hypothetical protein